MAGRTRPEWEPLIGLFVNTLALRADVGPAREFTDWVRRVRTRTLRAHDRQEAPFEQVVEAVKPERDAARAAIFQVMFSVQNTPAAVPALGELRLAPVETAVTTAKFELSLTVRENADGTLALGLEYNQDLFDAGTAEHFIERYGVLLGAIAANPKTVVRSLAWMSAAEAARIAGWSRGPALGKSATAVPEAVAAQAARTPDAVAVAAGAVRWSYAELMVQAGNMAARLRAGGVRRGGTVAILADREPALVAAMLGIWQIGAAYVPLDTEAPPERWRAIVADHGLDAVLLPAAWRGRWPANGAGTVIAWDEAGAINEGGAPQRVHAEETAYILFTSGSTGQPKGVAVPHGALAAHMAWFNAAYEGGPDDVVLQKTPATFDASVWEFWAPLMTGGRLELAPPGAQRDPAALVAAIQRAGVTWLQAVPTLWERLAVEPGFAEVRTLRRLFSGGEVLTTALRNALAQVQPVPLVNLYGPTETTIQCATWTCGAHDGTGAAVPLGAAVPGSTLQVVDADGAPVATGVAGELHVGGAQVAAGYWRRPELTAESFRPDPAAATPGARRYATGDLVRWRADGVLDYLGRRDGQVKLRGFRLELGEVETVLAAVPGVVKAAAAVRDGRLTGYVEWPGAPEGWTKDLRAAATARLPHYMIPARWARVESWPLLTSGKVDRNALPEAPDAATEAGATDAPPADAVEELLAGLWRELLRVPRVGRHDNFFTLGGDSILALQIAARAAAAGVRVPPQAVFTQQTLAELAAVAETAGPGATAKRAAEGAGPRVTPAQQWFFELGLTAPAHWNQSALFVTPADFDAARCEAALRAVAARHDVLRSRFERGADGWTVRWADSTDAAVACETRPLATLAEAAARAQASLDLARGPLLRAVVFVPETGGEGRLLVVAHHLVIDGVSWRILLAELAAAYGGERLPPAAPTWAAWTHALAAEAESAESQAERTHWRGVPAAEAFPRDFATTGAGVVADEKTIEVALTAAETAALLHDAGAAYRTQGHELLLAATAQALRGWTGRAAHTILMEGHGRETVADAPDVSGVLGWFTTLFPVRITAEGGEPGEWVKTVKEESRAVPRRGLSYGLARTQGATDGQAALAAQAWPELAFNYLGQLDAESGPAGFRAATEARGADRAAGNARAFLLECNAAVSGGVVRCAWTYSRAHHRAETIAALAAGQLAALRAIIAHCTTAGAGGFTPSDFSADDVSQKDLDKLFERLQ